MNHLTWIQVTFTPGIKSVLKTKTHSKKIVHQHPATSEVLIEVPKHAPENESLPRDLFPPEQRRLTWYFNVGSAASHLIFCPGILSVASLENNIVRDLPITWSLQPSKCLRIACPKKLPKGRRIPAGLW